MKIPEQIINVTNERGEISPCFFGYVDGTTKKYPSEYKYMINSSTPFISLNNEPVKNVKISNASSGKVWLQDSRGICIEMHFNRFLEVLEEVGYDQENKCLKGDFIYGFETINTPWLLPFNGERHTNQLKLDKIQSSSISIKELIPGAVYMTKNEQHVTYMGTFPSPSSSYDKNGAEILKLKNKKFFMYTDTNKDSFFSFTPITYLSEVVVPYPSLDYDSNLEKLYKSKDYSDTFDVEITPFDDSLSNIYLTTEKGYVKIYLECWEGSTLKSRGHHAKSFKDSNVTYRIGIQNYLVDVGNNYVKDIYVREGIKDFPDNIIGKKFTLEELKKLKIVNIRIQYKNTKKQL